MLNIWGKLTNKPLGYLNVITGTACSLKCKDCANLIPYVKPVFYRAKDIISDIKKILSVYKDIEILQLQGGEALIHPEIAILLKYIASENRIKKLQLSTNGVAPLTQELIDIFKNDPKIFIGVSQYAPYVNSQKFVDTLEKNDIQIKKYRFATQSGEWYDMGGVDKQRETHDDMVRNRFETCPYKICATLDNGIVGRCGRSTVARQVFSLTNSPDDYLLLRKIKPWGKQRIHNYFENPKCIESCYYCNGASGEKIQPAIQL